jgi:L-2-hydroxyglutarate oxidase LhgO
MDEIQVAVIGAGVVGLAVAAEAAQNGAEVYVFEKNRAFGMETSSRNSEVIHSGIYYPRGTLKDRLCLEGNRLLYEICEKNGIGYKRTGKLIVAADKSRMSPLEGLYRRGLEKELEGAEMLTGERVSAMEPAVNALAGLYLASTGIIDTHRLMEYYISVLKDNGGDVIYDCDIRGIGKRSGKYRISAVSPGESYDFIASVVVNSAGLDADTVADMSGTGCPSYELHYCKGSYFRLTGVEPGVISRPVYPVAGENDVSLGVHITPDLAGYLRLGPDAVYTGGRTRDYSVAPSLKDIFYDDIKRFMPSVSKENLIPDTAGIRPKLQAPDEGFRDFVIEHEKEKGFEGFINLIGIESPGLTASPAIGRYVSRTVMELL